MSSLQTNQASVKPEGRRVSSAGGLFPDVLNEAQTAAFLGVSSRTLLKLRKEPWFPNSVTLSPRVTRWLRDELIEALATRAPRGEVQAQPLHLRGNSEL